MTIEEIAGALVALLDRAGDAEGWGHNGAEEDRRDLVRVGDGEMWRLGGCTDGKRPRLSLTARPIEGASGASVTVSVTFDPGAPEDLRARAVRVLTRHDRPDRPYAWDARVTA